MPDIKTTHAFVPLQQAATALGVPASWLKAEAKAARVPSLKVGRKLLFEIAAVKGALSERAQQVPQGTTA